jgi:hypothetical protein
MQKKFISIVSVLFKHFNHKNHSSDFAQYIVFSVFTTTFPSVNAGVANVFSPVSKELTKLKSLFAEKINTLPSALIK